MVCPMVERYGSKLISSKKENTRMSITNMPGFTAESSLYRSRMNYPVSVKGSPLQSLVQPAQSDTFNPNRQIPSLSSGEYHPHPTWCLKTQIIFIPGTTHVLRWQTLGVWDPLT